MSARKQTEYSSYKEPPARQNQHQFYGIKVDPEQERFRDLIWDKAKLIIFCDAKAGTGKTTIAIATANLLVRYGLYEKVFYIVSPCNEDKVGMLPGGLDCKQAPYNTPMYQALVECGEQPEKVVAQEGAEKNGAYFFLTSHVYLRGSNIKNSVVIIDEAQNYSMFDLKKTLTRCHDTSKVIVIGHTGQRDVYVNGESAFTRAIKHFKDDPRTAVCNLSVNYRGWVANHADMM